MENDFSSGYFKTLTDKILFIDKANSLPRNNFLHLTQLRHATFINKYDEKSLNEYKFIGYQYSFLKIVCSNHYGIQASDLESHKPSSC